MGKKEPTTGESVLAEIEAYLKAANMAPTAFGTAVVKDPNLVRDLRTGSRDLKASTIDTIRAFIRKNPPQA